MCKYDSQRKRAAALTLVTYTAVLYISPTSNIISELIRLYMATLIAIDKDYENHIIIYPSESVFSEASLELISEGNVLKEILQELDLTLQLSGTILIQIKNYAYKDSKIKYELEFPLLPYDIFEDNLANELKDNNLGLLLHVQHILINLH
ncbi:624_t:CDS:2 [Funneliformis caledonium]|uniref:624_t:CDS:1 n=1 Tax=Funneliformis caledonium TaxID=1117310 RepID=A0A9N9BF07_9GLOM|nr:624_t:CDS:2 [Funneliformis caledonium]